MTKRNICLVAVIGVVLLAGMPVVQADPTDTLLASIGEFQLDSGQTKTVHHNDIQGYRVCMEEGRHAVPLKVTYDDKVAIVDPGECQLIEATRIKLASAAKLHAGMTLIGSIDSNKRSWQHKTEVSVAQAARND